MNLLTKVIDWGFILPFNDAMQLYYRKFYVNSCTFAEFPQHLELHKAKTN